MKDNLSIVITIILLVLLMVIFPLYNFFERQDDMSYNLVLKATSKFADEVMNNGYIDQRMYDNFVQELGNTGNVYDIEIEAHRKVLIADSRDSNNNIIYGEQSYIDYSDDIFDSFSAGATSNLMKKSLKNDIYYFNPKDEIYVKVKNSNTTMAGSLFNAIIPTSKKNRIQVNYGGIIKNNAWKQVDATYTGHYIIPGAPVIKIGNGVDEKNIDDSNFNINDDGFYLISPSNFDRGVYAYSTYFEGNTVTNMLCKIVDLDSNETKELNISNRNVTGSNVTFHIDDFVFENEKKYDLDISVVDEKGYSSDHTKLQIYVTNDTQLIHKINGDFVKDGVVDEKDIEVLYNHFVNDYTLSDAEQKIADYNNDGKFSIKDYFDMQKSIYGYILGDINKDNMLNVQDATKIQKYITNSTLNPLNNEEKKIADINKDGKIDNKDLGIIQKLSLI